MHAVSKVTAVLKEVAAVTTPELPMQQLRILLALVDSAGPLSMQELLPLTDVSQASVSRNCQALGIGVKPGVPGYQLIETYEDPEYRRRKLVRLSQKGEVLRKKLKELG